MSELINIWREMWATNRFADTKLVFFIGVVLAILSIENTPALALHGPAAILRGGNSLIMIVVGCASLVVAATALIPQLAPTTRYDWLIPECEHRNLFYFISIANFASGEDWLTSAGMELQESERHRAAMIANQIHVLAKITARKFGSLRLALLVLFGGWCLSWSYSLVAY